MRGDELSKYIAVEFQYLYQDGQPILEGGAGAKDYVIAGPEAFPQPFLAIASLTANDVRKVAFSVCGGVKFRVIPHMCLRAEFRDYLTTFPRQQIVAASHNTAWGIFEQFTPLVGISYAPLPV